ncbi:hypothetical protein [Fischerella sp. PCC 9605]|nr:hypothetical protein [Fischerella sp. PCC 9605]
MDVLEEQRILQTEMVLIVTISPQKLLAIAIGYKITSGLASERKQE